MAGVKAPTKVVQLFQLTCFPLGHKVSTYRHFMATFLFHTIIGILSEMFITQSVNVTRYFHNVNHEVVSYENLNVSGNI